MFSLIPDIFENCGCYKQPVCRSFNRLNKNFGLYICNALQSIGGPFYQRGLTLIPAWMNNYIPSKEWDGYCYAILKLQRLPRWIWGMDNWFHLTLCNGCTYISMPGITLTHVSNRGPRHWYDTCWMCYGECAIPRWSAKYRRYSEIFMVQIGENVAVWTWIWWCLV